jgi:AcrR family transcriptional regulator
MGRRSEHSKEELHILIVNATLELVREQGASKVTARQIAQAVGYTPGMLYSVFENLQAIFLHVNVQSLDSLYSHCMRAQKKAKGPEDSIRAMGIAYLAFASSHTHQFQLMFQPMPESNTPQPAELGSRIRALFELVEHDLLALDPDASEPAIKLGARTLWSGVHGAAALSLTDQLYCEEKNADQLIVNMLVSRFVDSWQK